MQLHGIAVAEQPPARGDQQGADGRSGRAGSNRPGNPGVETDGATAAGQTGRSHGAAALSASARFQGLVGTVLSNCDLGSAGKVTKADVLAAAPEKHFGEAALKAARDFISIASLQSPQGCWLAQENMRLIIEFTITAQSFGRPTAPAAAPRRGTPSADGGLPAGLPAVRSSGSVDQCSGWHAPSRG